MKQALLYFAIISTVIFGSCMLFEANDSIISTPVDGQIVAGTITVLVTPPEDIIVDEIDFFVDDSLLNHVTTEPWQSDWDTREVTNGPHRILVEVYGLENEELTNAIEVIVQND